MGVASGGGPPSGVLGTSVVVAPDAPPPPPGPCLGSSKCESSSSSPPESDEDDESACTGVLLGLWLVQPGLFTLVSFLPLGEEVLLWLCLFRMKLSDGSPYLRNISMSFLTSSSAGSTSNLCTCPQPRRDFLVLANFSVLLSGKLSSYFRLWKYPFSWTGGFPLLGHFQSLTSSLSNMYR